MLGGDLTGADVIDLDDTATILPGMFDLHAHYNLDLVDEGRAEEVTSRRTSRRSSNRCRR